MKFEFTARYYLRKGAPVGSRLLGLSRNAVKAMREHFRLARKRDYSHLIGFDTFLDRLRGLGLVRLADKPLAYQRTHSLVKRR